MSELLSRKLLAPPKGSLYHGIHPGGNEGEENVVLKDPGLIDSYAATVGHQPAFVYFSHEWGHSENRSQDMANHAFPLAEIRAIAAKGRIPFIRLMLRTSSDEACKTPEEYFVLENIVGTNPEDAKQKKIFDEINADLREWGRVAREEYVGPLIVEWGTETNNKTFHWNPACRSSGDKAAAVALFRKTFRHIVRTVTGPDSQNSNLTWVFHVTADDDPNPAEHGNEWNRMADYYPDGTKEDPVDVVDWLGVSVYGADNLRSGQCETFSTQLDRALGRKDGRGEGEKLLALAYRGRDQQKPIFIVEFGTALNYNKADRKIDRCVPATWIGQAFTEIFNRAKTGEIAGFSWWNERFRGGGRGRKWLEMRFDHLQESGKDGAAILEAYNTALNNSRVMHVAARVE